MATEKRDDEIGVTAVGLESLERNFVDVMKELSAEDSLERFRFEYEKLHRALKKSHESEKRLTKKCQELHEEIVANTTKLHTALYLSQDDENTILSLRKEIEKAWKTVDVNQEKELKAKDTIKQLRKDVVRLTSLVEQGAGLSSEHESNIQDLIDKKRELARTRDATRLKVHQQDHEIDELNGKLKKLQTDLEVTDIDLVAKKTQYQQQYKNFETHQKERDISERKVREFHLAIEKRAKEAEVAKETLRVRASEQETLDLEVVEEKDRLASLVKRVAEAQQQLADETQSLSKVDHQNIQLRGEIPRMQHVLDKKEEELVRVNRNVDKILRVIDGQDAELVRLNAEQEEEAAKIPLIKDKIDKYLIEIASERNLIESHDKAAADIMARKNLTINKWANEESERVKLEGMRILEEGNNRSLTHTLATHLETNQLMRDKIGILNQQQKKYFEDAREATGKYHYVVEEEKLTTERSATLKLELDDVDMKLKKQKKMYSQVRSERALFKKSLIDAQSEIDALHRKFKLMDHHIEHLKDDLGIKEKLLCEVHATHKQLEKDIMSANERVNHLKEDYIHAKGRGDALEDEIKQLTQIVNDCDFEKGKQQMKYNAVVNERNILSTQLIHRNDELSILYEKIRIQQSTLSKGEAQYRDRLVDVRMLRDKVDNMRVSLRAAIDCIQNIDEMKQKVTTLQRFVLQERTKVKALYEELQNPMNVHRWRKMEGSAPKEMDNILKSQVLQKRLLIKVEECREKDLVIKNKENQYKQLKNILSRQPGPEIAEHLNIYHENLLKRAVQASNMEQHLSETRSQVTEYKDEADTLNRELVEVKSKFFGLKSKNRTLKREHMLVLNPYGVTNSSDSQWGTFPIRQPIDQPRFAGGGFALS